MTCRPSGALCIRAHRCEEWNTWIDLVPHDIYHRAEYHLLAERRGEGAAHLAVFGDTNRFLAWPYLLLPLASVRGLEFTDRCDVTSVYGYPGPLTRGCSAGSPFLDEAMKSIRDLWCRQKVVSVFTRTNPFFQDATFCKNVCAPTPVGQTISVDLEVSLEQSWAGYRRGHRYEICKGREAGLRVREDDEWRYLDEFFRLYSEAMQRKGAADCYLFEKDYFLALREALRDACHLLVVLQEKEIAAGAIFTESCGIVQYHLSATCEAYRRLAPAKILLDGARIWAKARGNKALHLGGGVGGAEDSLFFFKAGFSSRRHPFFVWHAVLDQSSYDSLAGTHAEFRSQHGLVPESPGFFPSYRQPVVALEPLCQQA